ncbi:MAG: DRTGG domain-containing protein [Ignavibacteriales bacterium]|nr:DRTGG domain-containing protein [Ignavibacteriales bacterium]
MKLKDVVERLHLSVLTGQDRLDQVVTGGYASDLLSDVIANSRPNSVWVTMHIHENIVAVAVLKDLAGIIIVQGRQPAPETLQKAAKEKVVIMVSDLPAFETIGKLSPLFEGGT